MRGLSWRNFDFLLFGAVVLASAFGAMMIRSAIAGNTDLAGYDTRQAYFAAAGAIVIVLLASIDYRYWISILWRAALVPGGHPIHPAHRICQDCGHPDAGAFFRAQPSRCARSQVVAEKP